MPASDGPGVTPLHPARLASLLGRRVVSSAGDDLGRVHDFRVRRDGPYIPDFGPALRVEAVVIGAASLASRLGLSRPDVRGPWPLGAWGRRVARSARLVPWDALEERDGNLVCAVPRERLERAHP